MNLDGDDEPIALLPAGSELIVQTYAGHAWRVLDGWSGALLAEVVAQPGQHHHVSVVPPLRPAEAAGSSAAGSSGRTGAGAAAGGGDDAFSGFDGIGGAREAYLSARVQDVQLDHLGGVALLAIDSVTRATPIAVGLHDAVSLFHASGVEFRRPTTIATWVRSLAAAGASLDRVLLTRRVGSTTYARLVISSGRGQKSIDARPADCLALALQTGAPLFVHQRLLAGGGSSMEDKREVHSDHVLSPQA